MENTRSIAATASIFVLFLTTFAASVSSSDEPLDSQMKTFASCVEGFNTCRDFMADARCFSKSIWKRTNRADASGPFWANRGKREPLLTNSRLFAEEPRWELVRRDQESLFEPPYFATRGKKRLENMRDRRNEEKIFLDAASPFLAARGKKDNAENLAE